MPETATIGVSEELMQAKQAAVSQFLKRSTQPHLFTSLALSSTKPHHNVVGIGIGPKIVNGRPTQARAIRLYVERKLDKDIVPEKLALPQQINGVPTDVIETGRFRKLPVAIPKEQRRLRPARPGCSVGFEGNGFVTAGTFGAVTQANGKLYILSNNHVLADENRLPLLSPIFQPGLLDHGDAGKDRVARLKQFVALRTTAPNRVDCAIALVDDPTLVSARCLPKVGKLNDGIPVPATEGMRVHKVGRTTGYTQGVVFDVSADVTVEYEIGNIVFQDQVLIRGTTKPLSAAGDSGSLIVDRDTKRPTALLFAGSSTYSIGNHLGEVLSQLGVSVVV